MPYPRQRLLLVRHAQGSLGSEDYDQLSSIGFRQAEEVAQHLHSFLDEAVMVRGELKRHRQTADSLCRFGPCRIDPDLNEYRVDHLLEAAFENAGELALQPPGPEALADPVGYLDTFLALFPRVLEAWQAERIHCTVNGRWSAFSQRVEAAGRRFLPMLEQSGSVVAVTSAGVISTLVASLLGRELTWQRQLNVTLYNASVTELHLDAAGAWRVERLNCIEHLPPGDLHTLA
ncbi:MAG: histidine phosphatase family protein [Wenzhouxiangellaceae bacterium]